MARPQKVRDLGPRLREVLHYFWPYTRPHCRPMTGSFLAIVAEVLLRLLEPWMLALVLDYVLVPQQGRPRRCRCSARWTPTLLLIASIGTVLTVGLRALAAYSAPWIRPIGNRVLTDVRADLYRHLHSLSLNYHNKARKGDLTVRVIGDIGLLKDVVVTAVLPLLGNLFVLVGMVTVLFWLNWQLALLSMVTVPSSGCRRCGSARRSTRSPATSAAARATWPPAPRRRSADADRAGPVAGAVVRGLLLRAQQGGASSRASRAPGWRPSSSAPSTCSSPSRRPSSCTSAPGWCSTATSRPAP